MKVDNNHFATSGLTTGYGSTREYNSLISTRLTVQQRGILKSFIDSLKAVLGVFQCEKTVALSAKSGWETLHWLLRGFQPNTLGARLLNSLVKNESISYNNITSKNARSPLALSVDFMSG